MKIARIVAVLLTIVSLWLATRLGLSKDLTTLFPHTPEAAALARVTRDFGGGDVALVLLRGETPANVTAAAKEAAAAMRALASVASVLDEAPSIRLDAPDPTEAWRFAGPLARERLAAAVTEDGMRARLRETRQLLLAPGASEIAGIIARDPLRLSAIPWADPIELAAGVKGTAGGAFEANGGKARLVTVEPRGRVFDPGVAARFTNEAEAAIAKIRTAHPDVRIDLTGGHVIARQTELLMRGDLQKSGILSGVLAAVVFAITFRRVRALLAVLPPLLAGTLWTTALAATVYPRLSAVATAFAAVVVGVGVDTGVHVYGRLLEARRDGHSPDAAAEIAWRTTWRPTLGAALAAGGAFGCLALSEIEGMRQLGVLCAAGEVLTAIAILLVVPSIGALLEKGPPPKAPTMAWVAALTATRRRSLIALVLVGATVVVSLGAGWPKIDRAVVALDGRVLPAVATYDAIYATFGGTRGQLAVVSADPDPARARARADAVAEAADRMLGAPRGVLGFDALARVAPSPELQTARLAERDLLDLPGKKALLAKVLVEEGFALDEVEPALEAFAHPSHSTADILAKAPPAIQWLARRHLATDAEGAIAVSYLRLAPDADVAATLRGADPDVILTGYADLEKGLARTLAHDLPRVLGGALLLVIVMLAISLRKASRVALAVLVLAVEIVLVLALSKLIGVRWHVYDALVLPVLLGITLDEVLFLLEAADVAPSIETAIAAQAPLGTSTALTTAAGFGALAICRFEGLVDVGKVGALGSIVGLLVALVVIPAVYRLRAAQT